ncbi:MAG: DUF4147 domain-containing protein [Planctomycetota bacterium]
MNLEIKKTLQALVDQVLEYMSAGKLFARHQTSIESPDDINEVGIISIGKMGCAMAFEFARLIDGPTLRGVVSDPYDNDVPRVDGISYFKGGHPYPNQDSLQAARAALELVAHLDENALVVFLVSGGGSAAFELPRTPLSLSEIQSAYRILVESGAEIREINTIRNALSQVKNGRLAAACESRQKTFVISDVPGEQLGFVSSGPSISVSSECRNPLEIIELHQLRDKLPPPIIKALEFDAVNHRIIDDVLHNQDHPSLCLASNDDAIAVAAQFCESLGWETSVVSDFDESDLETATRGLLEMLNGASNGLDRPRAVVAGGEVRCEVIGNGKGGRNQAFVMDCIRQIAGQNIAVLSFGTDGIDGNSDAAGALADGSSLHRCEDIGIDIETTRKQSNSNYLFSRLDDLILTGPTQINLRDVRVLVCW